MFWGNLRKSWSEEVVLFFARITIPSGDHVHIDLPITVLLLHRESTTQGGKKAQREQS